MAQLILMCFTHGLLWIFCRKWSQRQLLYWIMQLSTSVVTYLMRLKNRVVLLSFYLLTAQIWTLLSINGRKPKHSEEKNNVLFTNCLRIMTIFNYSAIHLFYDPLGQSQWPNDCSLLNIQFNNHQFFADRCVLCWLPFCYPQDEDYFAISRQQ